MEEQKKTKVNLKDLTYQQITELLINNPELPINAGVLFMVLAKQERYFREVYGLKLKQQLVKPDTNIKDLNGNDIIKK